MIPAALTALSDIETTKIEYTKGGCIIYPKKTHLIISKDYERKKMYSFGPHPDSLLEGVDFLERSQLVVFHNGNGFDVPTLKQNFDLKVRDDDHFVDSLVLCRLFYSNIKEELDFELFRKGQQEKPSRLTFTGNLIGSHSLEAWGLRLKNPRPKTDYEAICKAAGIDDIWAEWNPIMQDYAVQDVEVLEGLWEERLVKRFKDVKNKQAIAIEHYLEDLMEQVKRSGIKVDVAWARNLVSELMRAQHKVAKVIEKEFPPRYEPKKWVYKEIPVGQRCEVTGDEQRLTPLMYEHEKSNIYRPRFNLPEGYQREWWGEEFIPKVSRDSKTKDGKLLYRAEKGCPFTKIEMKPLNPGSRVQIVRRLLELGWQPEEFTDSGNPTTSEVELQKIEEQFPAAMSLAHYLLIQKRLGAVSSGDKAWLNLLDDEGFIHPTIRPNNTVAFRATHSDPNISQVPSVKMIDDWLKDLAGNFLFDDKGKKIPDLKENGKQKQHIGKGEEGKWGWDCRACFTVPDGFTMVGADLAGIEMRAWAHYLWKYDDGAFADIVLNKDVHEENRLILGFSDRRKAKEWLYAAMYGAGDEKLGFIIEPLASKERQKQLGAASRARFMRGLKGYARLNEELVKGVAIGYVRGLDGRKVPVRKPHAALNALLQSAGAIISKYWIVFVLQIIEDRHGLKWGYENDFTLMLYSHDELQFAVRPQYAQIIKDACTEGALTAGKHLDFKLPVEIGLAQGNHWGDTH